MQQTTKELLVNEGLDQTVWGRIIIIAAFVNYFNADDKDKANGWFSCACGNLDGHIEKNDDGAPEDAVLLSLGLRFSDIVLREPCDAYGAAETLVAIEKRSIELLSKA
jgi:hypothetical protein